MQSAGLWALILSLIVSSLGIPAAAPAAGSFPPMPAAQSSSLSLIAPSACPPDGCSGGQRISMRFSFIPTTYDPNQPLNIEICILAPDGWQVTPAVLAPKGKVSLTPYTPVTPPSCPRESPPTGYTVIAAASAQLAAGTPSDAIDFAIRLGKMANGDGQLLARLYENNPANNSWSRTANVTSPILTATQTPNTGIVYVTNDAGGCGATVNCFINSGDDLDTGLGTGLKDAVDAAAPGMTIYVMGTYAIKGNPVVINKAVTVAGLNDATITNGTSVCGNAMLSLNDAVTLRDLNINDGGCASPGRDLVDINSAGAVVIESNDLIHGDNAIHIEDSNTGLVTIRFNNITNNTGYAVFASDHVSNGPVNITANNLSGNRSGQAIDCSGKLGAAADVVPFRRANHNYWGGGLPNPTGFTHCTIGPGKVLGMPIALRANQPGVDAQLVPLNGTPNYVFNNQIGAWHTGGPDFSIYIVNHGYMTPYGPPFTYSAGGQSPSPCSNYWDVFLSETVPSIDTLGTLELTFRYDKTAACIATINSTQYCEQTTTPAKYPLYWYDPATGLTNGWDTTAQKPDNLQSSDGQVTTCHPGSNEIQVSIDNNGRPNLAEDMVYLPFMVGVPVIKSFQPLASSQQISVTWTTNNEPDISGFYVLRGTSRGQLNPITDLITHTGAALIGKSYTYADTGRTNGTEYFYRLQVVRTDGSSIFSDIKSIIANVATVTPLPSATPTRTATPVVPTATRTFTFVPYKSPTRVVTRTFTPVSGQSSSGSRTSTPTPRPGQQTTATLTAIARTLLAPLDQTDQPGTFEDTPLPGDGTAIITLEPAQAGTLTSTFAAGTGTAVAAAGGTGTLTPTTSLTPMPGALENPPANTHPWLSLLLGILGGLAAVGGIGAAWYFLRVKSGA